MSFDKPLLVVAALIEDSRGILVAQRDGPGDFAGLWELPGGKVAADEDPKDSLIREIKEELDCIIEVDTIEEVLFHRYRRGQGEVSPPKEFNLLMLVYRARIVEGEPRPIECQDVRWMSRSKLGELTWLPADQPIIDRLQQD